MTNAQAERSIQILVKTLSESPVPLTKTGLAAKSNLSYNTVKTHLPATGAIESNQFGTLVYSLNGKTVDSGIKLKWSSHIARKSNRTIKLDLLELPDAVGTYEKLASRIPMALPSRIRPEDDPKDLADSIAQYAIFLASVAAKLQEQQDNPEWFRKLGGDDGYFTPLTALNN